MGQCVYLVDDDLLMLELISAQLMQGGYQVCPYSDPEEFLRAAPSLEPGCVVLDLDMPQMDGLQVQEALVRMGIEFPVIFYTGTGTVKHVVEGMTAGAADFLQKHHNAYPLLNALKSVFQDMPGAGSARPANA